MRAEPSVPLIGLLERLDLASPQQVRRVSRRVARLARDLPLFDSVWVDALVQARILTPFQAAEINAGRGDRLAVGPFTLCRPLDSAGYAECFRARRRGTSELVRLTLVRPEPERATHLLQAIEQLAQKSRQMPAVLAPLYEAGCDEGRIWMAGPDVTGCTAAEWMVTHGRFPAEVVLEIARQMVAALAALEPLGDCHGDISAAALVLTPRGEIVLPQPGVRAAVRPAEGFARADLLPRAYDYLAPERIEEGIPPAPASEVFACGCLWWHLITGRPPFAGGSAVMKLQAAQQAEIPDVRRWAPDNPAPLVAAISAAVQRDPAMRPDSLARLAAMLGPPTKQGRLLLRRYLTRPSREPVAWAVPARAGRQWQQQALWLSMAGGCLVAALALGWSLWLAGAPDRARLQLQAASASAAVGTSQPRPVSEVPAAMRETAVERSGSPEDPVRLASHQNEPSATALGLPSPENARKDDLVLPSDGPVTMDPRQIRPGQIVRGEEGKRPMVIVPDSGMTLVSENVRFENVDFVWETPAAARSPRQAMIHLRTSRVEFRGCSFQSARPASPLPAAIHWTYPLDPAEAERSLPSGEIAITDCVLRNVASGVVLDTRAALAVRLENVLFLGRGAMLTLERYPSVDEPLVVRMAGVTLRDSGPLIHCSCDFEHPPGAISIVTDCCALAPARQIALLTFASPRAPDSLLPTIQWSGQGSLVSPRAMVACWQAPDGRNHPLDDNALAIAGLVRSEMEFAGPGETGSEANRIVRWQAPLHSAEEPGFRAERLVQRGLRHWVGRPTPAQ